MAGRDLQTNLSLPTPPPRQAFLHTPARGTPLGSKSAHFSPLLVPTHGFSLHSGKSPKASSGLQRPLMSSASTTSALLALGSSHTSLLAVTQICPRLFTLGSSLFTYMFLWPTSSLYPGLCSVPLPHRHLFLTTLPRSLPLCPPISLPGFLVAPAIYVRFISLLTRMCALLE